MRFVKGEKVKVTWDSFKEELEKLGWKAQEKGQEPGKPNDPNFGDGDENKGPKEGEELTLEELEEMEVEELKELAEKSGVKLGKLKDKSKIIEKLIAALEQ